MDRLEFLKRLGALTVGASLIGIDGVSAITTPSGDVPPIAAKPDIDIPVEPLYCDVPKPVTMMIIGAGNRGRTYAKYAELYPHALKIVGAADIDPKRLRAMGKKHNIPKEHLFNHYNEAFAHAKLADTVLISTPDELHYEPCMKALEVGYDVLLEKPVAPTEKECRNILNQAKKYNRIVAVCHILRYAPYYRALKKVLESGAVGDIVNIQLMEPVEFDHMAHSYVRGIWRSSKQSTPIILAKSCHDLDILRWMIGKPCESIAAEGSLYLFRSENAPQGAPERCTDGCPHEPQCPFSAINIYERKKRYCYAFDLPRKDAALIHEKLQTTNYGRCVFRCDNDQCDHYVTIMRFKDGVTASFTMDAFTPFGGRRIRIMGTKGFIEGDGKRFSFHDFLTGHVGVWHKNVHEMEDYKHAGHGGGDMAMMRDFVRAISAQDESLLSSSIDASIESHVMGFMAEKSRKSKKKVTIKM